MHFQPPTTEQYAKNVLNAHQTNQYDTKMFGHHSPPTHTITPNDGQNTHWFASQPSHQTQQQHMQTQVQSQIKNVYEENNIIIPPENRNKIETKKETFIVVDSRSRNHTDYPHPNQYSMPLASEIRDVESIQLISYNIPKPQFPIRESNNRFHYTITSPTLVPNADGSVSVELNKTMNLKSFSIQPGLYESTLSEYDTTIATVQQFKTELDNYITSSLKKDMLSVALETALNENTNTTCMVYIEEHNEQYTILTNFACPAANGEGDDCEDASFFHPFFEGCDEFYGSTTIEKVDICKPNNTPCDNENGTPVYSYEQCGKKQKTYLKNSIGEIIGHPRIDSSLQLTGKGDNTIDSTKLNGVGTQFLTELRPGDWVYVVGYDSGSIVRLRFHVHEVNSNTECSIDITGDGTGVGPSSFEDAFMWVGRLTLPWARNLNPDYYIAMYINNASTLQSYTQSVDRAFFLVPGKRPFYEIKQYLPYKKFSPTKGSLDKLDITFRNADNSLYDFKGRNHTLIFKVVHFRQNISYGDF